MHKHTHTHTHTHTHIHKHTHNHTQPHTHTHTHIHTNIFLRKSYPLQYYHIMLRHKNIKKYIKSLKIMYYFISIIFEFWIKKCTISLVEIFGHLHQGKGLPNTIF